MHIKLDHTPKSNTAILAALDEANGRATEHTYTTTGPIYDLFKDATLELDESGVTLKQRARAIVSKTSGGQVAQSYKYARRLTSIEIEIGSNGKDAWLVSVEGCKRHGGSNSRICLTAWGHASWLAKCAKQFGVLVGRK